MTREEMLEQLEDTILLIRQHGKDWFDERDIPILEAAIKAMKTEPCGDVISRQAVLDKAKYWIAMQETKTGFIEKRGYFVDADDIKALPSVQPEQKIGHWIPRNSFLLRYKCSECERESEEYNYCPNCGAKMEEGE